MSAPTRDHAGDLDAMQRAWARRPHPWETATWRMRPPSWLTSGDLLHRQLEEFPTLYRVGEVIWARIYIANKLLSSPQDTVAPAGLVYSHDPVLQRHPQLYEQVRGSVWDLRGRGSQVPVLRDWATRLRDDTGRGWREQLPTALTAGRVVWRATALVFPHQLPGRCVVKNQVPLIADTTGKQTQVVTLLPQSFWPESLRDWWEQDTPE